MNAKENSIMNFPFSTLLILFVLSILGCNEKEEPISSIEEPRKKIEMTTNYGTMVIELYDETPLHRDNFVNLAKNKAYDSLLFHRVIEEFMIQGGDPESKEAQPNDTLGDGDAPYVVSAEFNSKLFHKKGVLAAARDDHPERASSAMQFYIVQGRVFNDSLLAIAEERINRNMAIVYFRKITPRNPILDSLQGARNSGNFKYYTVLGDSILKLARAHENFTSYIIPDDQRAAYKSIGGTPHLDQNYTVFGEVIQGLDVVDSIAGVATESQDRPLKEVRILKVRLME